jgi:hypothetical protein
MRKIGKFSLNIIQERTYCNDFGSKTFCYCEIKRKGSDTVITDWIPKDMLNLRGMKILEEYIKW